MRHLRLLLGLTISFLLLPILYAHGQAQDAKQDDVRAVLMPWI